QAVAVQRLARQPQAREVAAVELVARALEEELLVQAVELVAHERVPDGGQMHADLVLASRVRRAGAPGTPSRSCGARIASGSGGGRARPWRAGPRRSSPCRCDGTGGWARRAS